MYGPKFKFQRIKRESSYLNVEEVFLKEDFDLTGATKDI